MTPGIGAVRLLRAGKLVAETQTDQHQRFRFTVSIGTYDVEADAFGSTCSRRGVRVRANRVSRASVRCLIP
jgi:hypothetical protein